MAKQNKMDLPKNAYSELKPGEKYMPIIESSKSIHEVTFRSVGWGIFMAVLFSAAAVYLGLKVALVFEAAIPISILAVGLSSVFWRRSTILENVILQSIGAASAAVAAGAIFVLPAIYILGLDKTVGINVFKLFIVAMFGGFLGILFLIPFRKYFVSDMHGKFPFPEATATTEVLVTGEKGGKHAITLVLAAGFAAVMDFLILSARTWVEEIHSTMVSFGADFYEKTKMVLKVDILASLTGLGYIIGLRYTAVIVAGSFVSWFILIPIISHIGAYITVIVPPASTKLISVMSADDIFKIYVQKIGIGAIAAAGIIGIIKSSKVIIGAFTKGFKEMFSKIDTSEKKSIRTDKDLKMSTNILGIGFIAIAILFFFKFAILNSTGAPWKLSFIALIVVLIIGFLFTSVAARAIAIVGTNPVSGMTLMTLILTSVVMSAVGLTGDYGMLSALLIGGVVCTSLSVAGAFITDLKIGYWIGSTPWNQERFKFIGVLVSAITATLVIILLQKTEGFIVSAQHPSPLPAPQATAMAAVLKAFMSAENVPWILFGLGVIIALIMEMAAVPTLAFALGMYIPQQYNVPLMLGGLISYLLVKMSKDKEIGQARREKGTLIASGFIAGGAIIGVISALLKLPKWDVILNTGLADKPIGQLFALLAYVLVLAYIFFFAWRVNKNKK
jgi:putative OPT family oligopeptide transporter